MWTLGELLEIRNRAELESGGNEQNLLWRHACVDLAASAERLISLTQRICHDELTALADSNGYVKLPPANGG